MTQLTLPFASGLTCHFGTEWLDHFQAPVGTGRGCRWCEMPYYGSNEKVS